MARLAQSVECKALNLVVVGSSPTVGVLTLAHCLKTSYGVVLQLFALNSALPTASKTASPDTSRALPTHSPGTSHTLPTHPQHTSHQHCACPYIPEPISTHFQRTSHTICYVISQCYMLSSLMLFYMPFVAPLISKSART